MKIDLIVDKGPFDLSLQRCCLIISIYYLVTYVLGVVIASSAFHHATTVVGFLVAVIGNICLLIGALRLNRWFVLVWLINAIFYYIQWPIAICGVIFNYGSYRYDAIFHNIFLIIIEYIVGLLIFAYLTRLVYSFFEQLKNTQANPQHAVVV